MRVAGCEGLNGKRAVIFWLIWSCLLTAKAQIFQYSLDKGLSQSTIYSILQDRDGFVWVATGDGVNRFDGYRFQKMLSADPGAEGHYFNSPLFEATNGTIWIGGTDGLYFRSPGASSLHRIKIHNRFADSSHLKVLGESDSGLWFFGNFGYLGFRHHRNGLISHIELNRSLDQFEALMSACMMESKTEILFLTSKGLRKFNISTHKLGPVILPFTEGWHIFPMRDGQVLIQGKEAYITNISNGKIRRIFSKKTENDDVAQMYFDDNVLYAGMVSGRVFVLDANTFTPVDSMFTESGEIHSNSGHSVFSFLKKPGLLFIGTDGGGLMIWNQHSQRFQKYQSGYYRNPEFRSEFIKCLFKDKYHRIWFGTLNGGLHILNRERNTVYFPSIGTGLKSHTVSAIFRAKNGTIWIGGDDGFYKTNDDAKSFEKITFDNPDNAFKGKYFINEFAELSDGTLLAPSYYGLYKFSAALNRFELISTLTLSILTTKEDSKHRIWVSTYFGHFGYLETKDLLIKPNLQRMHKIIFGKNIRSIYEDPATGTMYFGSESGLYELPSNPGSPIRLYNKRNGIQNEFIYGIIPGTNHTIWLSTNAGISTFDMVNKTFTNFKPEYNLQSAEFNTGAYYLSNDGEGFFGGVKGFNSFRIGYQETKDRNIPVRITNIKNGNTNLNADSVAKLDLLKLKPQENNLLVEFALLDYANPSVTQYSYLLKGGENRWIELGNNRRIFLSNLAPGQYELLVKAINWKGQESGPYRLLKFSVLTPWFKTWWFVITASLLTILGISLIVAFMVRKSLQVKLAEEKRQKEILQIKQNISRELHDNLGASLSRLSLMLQKNMVSNTANFPEMGNLTTEMNKQLSEIVWSVSTEHDFLDSLLAYIRSYATMFMEEAGIAVSFEFVPPDLEIPISPAIRQNLYAITKETLNNLAKYSGASEATLSFRMQHDLSFVYEITDNGKGFDLQNVRPFANGLKFMKQRMFELGFVFHIESTTPWQSGTDGWHGTRIQITGKLT